MVSTASVGSMEQVPVFQEPCRLLQLPDEVKLEIVKHIHRRRDLYNFSLACRSLEDITLGRLYKSVDLDIPSSECSNWSQDTLPNFRPFVLQNMRQLTIRNGVSNIKNPIYHKRRRSDANSMEGYVGEIFRAIPQDRLKSFSFIHKTPMSSQMLDGLAISHGNSLKHLQCCELELMSRPEASLPTNLRSIECRSVLSGEAITKLIALNKNTLRSLSLGQDKYSLQQYRQRRIGFLNNITQPSEEFHTTLHLSTIPNLEHLSLSGLDLGPITPQTKEDALFLMQLRSLTLESCPNTIAFLDTLSSTFSHNQTQPALQKFSFRHELATTPLQTSLINFLTSFKTLTSLSLLVENTTFTHRPSTFLKSHSTTLKHLVLESRIQPREHLHIDTSRPFGTGASQTQLWLDFLTDITTLCPNLVELGTAFPWDDATVQDHACNLATLKHLRTLHIRNFASSQIQGELSEAAVGNYASKLLAWCYPSSTSQPTLETLAIGPTLYSSRWRLHEPSPSTATPQTSQPQTHPVHTSQLQGSTAPRQRTLSERLHDEPTSKKQKQNPDAPAEHLRTHYFAIDSDGGSISSVTERYMEEARGQPGAGGIFEPVWLR